MSYKDPNGMLDLCLSLPDQLRKTFEKAAWKGLSTDEFSNIVFLGMGGSGVSGRIFQDLFYDEIKLPTATFKHYNLPAWVDNKSLVIAISQSGDTEETILSALEANMRGARVIAIASGGKLKELSSELGWDCLEVPVVKAPRGAIGNLFGTILGVANHLGIICLNTEEIDKGIDYLRSKGDEWRLDESLPWKLAQKINTCFPLIYASENYLSGIAFRFVTQLNENSGILAHYATMPDLCHNEIIAWQDRIIKPCVLYLSLGKENKRIGLRWRIIKDFIDAEKIELNLEKTQPLWIQGLALIHLIDLTSVYLAYIKGKDPMDISNIDFLKRELAKVNID